MLTVVVGAACKSLNNFHLPESLASLNKPEYKSVEPEVSYKPYRPMSTASDELLPVASEINGSATDKVVESTVVVVPLTVRLPDIVTLFGKPNVISLLETVVSISFAVPLNVIVSPPATESLEPESAANVYEVEIADVEAAVIRPCASTVITGTAVVEPYEPAETAVSSRVAVIVVPDAAVVIPVPPAIVTVSYTHLTLPTKA